MCWTCNSPMDASKSIRPLEDEGEEIEVDGKGKDKKLT